MLGFALLELYCLPALGATHNATRARLMVEDIPALCDLTQARWEYSSPTSLERLTTTSFDTEQGCHSASDQIFYSGWFVLKQVCMVFPKHDFHVSLTPQELYNRCIRQIV